MPQERRMPRTISTNTGKSAFAFNFVEQSMRKASNSQTLRWSAEADRFDSVGIFVQLNYEEGVPQCIIKGGEGKTEKRNGY